MWLAIFFAGLIIGACFGVVLMACISINRINGECPGTDIRYGYRRKG